MRARRTVASLLSLSLACSLLLATGTAYADEVGVASSTRETSNVVETADVESEAANTTSADADSGDGAFRDSEKLGTPEVPAAMADTDREEIGQDNDLLTDAELDALMVELDESEIMQYEEGDVSLVAQAVQGWSRIAGDVALDTMQKILQTEGVFADTRGGVVVVATADGYWDALAACGLAGVNDAPVVLTSTNALSAQATSEIARLRPERILVMGGSSAISDAVYAELAKLAPTIERIWGQTACDTAVKIYERGKGSWGTTGMAIICTSNGYWDALTIAPYAWATKCPIFLTDGNNKLSQSALDTLRSGGFTAALITGGTAAVSGEVEGQLQSIGITSIERKGGAIALDTSGLIAQWEIDHGMTLDHLAVATSDGYWDALAAAPLAGSQNSVIVLVSPSGDYRALDAVYNYDDKAIQHGHIIGGTSAIPNNVADRVMANWAAEGLTASEGTVSAGGTVTVNTVMVGVDPSQCTYKYSWQRGNKSGEAGQGNSPTCQVQLTTPGRNVISVEVTGPDGAVQSVSTVVNVLSAIQSSGDAELDGIVADIIEQHATGNDRLKAAYDYIVSTYKYGPGNRYPSGSWAEWSIPYAKEMYYNGFGNCYRFSSLMCWVARQMGYDAWVVSGETLSASGGWTAHSWVEVRTGDVYILDPEEAVRFPNTSFYFTQFDTAPIYYKYI